MNIAVFVICILLAATTIAFPTGALIYGKLKLRRALRPIEFYPPRGFSPIDVLVKYYGYHANTHALLNPMMLYWADRGFITIEEDCKRGLKLTKLRDIEPPTDLFKISDARTAAMVEQNYAAEETLFNAIFSEGDAFYTLAATSNYLRKNEDFIRACKDKAANMKSGITKKLSVASFIFALFSSVLATALSAVAAGGGPIFLPMIFPLVGMIAFRAIPNDGAIWAIKYPFFAVWGGAPLCVTLATTAWHVALPLACVIFASALTIFALASAIDIRRDDDLEVYGKICAFKTFLLDAESDRLETLVEENPNYYYDILPYCYILKITEKLKTKFDRVALDGPSWYLGDLRNTLMF